MLARFPTKALGPLACGLLIACGDTPTEPATGDCDVGELRLSVQAAAEVALDWSPRCPIALLFIEPVESAGDMWQVRSWKWDDNADLPSTDWNTIAPPVVYGVTPQGAEPEDYVSAESLTPGRYILTVMRILNTGLAANYAEFTIN